MDKASVTETVDSGSISDRVKSNTIKIDITAFLMDAQQLKEQSKAFIRAKSMVGSGRV